MARDSLPAVSFSSPERIVAPIAAFVALAALCWGLSGSIGAILTTARRGWVASSSKD